MTAMPPELPADYTKWCAMKIAVRLRDSEEGQTAMTMTHTTEISAGGGTRSIGRRPSAPMTEPGEDLAKARLQERSAKMDIANLELAPDVRLLMRELMHRISNEFASAISMVSITASRCSNAETKEALAGVQRHLEQYARVHHALRMPESGVLIDCSAHLQQLCRSASCSKLSARNIELKFIDNPLLMASERCWILAMIVHELITNSARHAFGQEGGKIQVELSHHEGLGRCVVSDNGVTAAGGRPGGGLEIVGSLVGNLNGWIDQKFGPLGSVSVVSFPLETRP
jgi:two-component sensor histidine kinase